MGSIRIVDVTDEPTFRLAPPCADPGFDHRSCDYWEDADGGSRDARPSWLEASSTRPVAKPRPSANPFLADMAAIQGARSTGNLFAVDDDDIDQDANPFAPPRPVRPTVGAEAPRKLRLLARGIGIFGSYAKVLLSDEKAAAWCQFGPLTAYPRAQNVRDLYPQLPVSPLPAVITCISTTSEARGNGHALALVEAVCDDLSGRGFSAVEAYPEAGAEPNATSAATTGFWIAAGFDLAIDDDRFPVVRRELE